MEDYVARKNNTIRKQDVYERAVIDNALIDEKIQVKNDDIASALFNQDPLYQENSDLDSMLESNRNFYQETSQKAFTAAMKEEKTRLKELLDATYYPEKNKPEDIGDVELMRRSLNLIM
jgi:hypothetical protein